MKQVYYKFDTLKGPAGKMSALFLIFLLCGIFLGQKSVSSASRDISSIIVLSDNSFIKMYLQSFALHLIIFYAFIKGYQNKLFIIKAYILAALIPSLCGINIGRLLAISGFLGLSAGIVSYMPHYILLIILYRKTLNKVLANDIFSTTDYIKYGIILLLISAVHVFVSGTLSGMLVQ